MDYNRAAPNGATTSPPPAPAAPGGPDRRVDAARRRPWRQTVLLCSLVLIALAWLLARLIWLWYYSGLFAFLVAGLLVGGLGFRVARAARPLAGRRILAGISFVAVVGWMAALVFESRHVAATIGGHPRFPEVRAKALAAGRTGADVTHDAAEAFRRTLAEQYRPGGTLGYIRWASGAGEINIKLDGESERVRIEHRGWAWLLRAAISLFLLMGGQWCALESLRSAAATSNILPPGAEYEPAD